MKRLPILCAFFALCCTGLYSQKIISQPDPVNWIIGRTAGNYNVIDDYYDKEVFTSRSAICYVDNDEVVLPIETRDGNAIVRLDTKGKTVWQQSIRGHIIAVCKSHQQVVVMYTLEWDGKDGTDGIIKTVHAVIVDPKTGSKISKKTVFENKKNIYAEPRAITGPDGQFHSLLIRYCPLPKKRFDAFTRGTAGFDLIFFTSAFDIKEMHSLNSVAAGNIFLAVLPVGEELYIATRAGGQIVFERFDSHSPSPLDKISMAAEISDESKIMPVSCTTNEQPDKVYFAIRCWTNNRKRVVMHLFSIDVQTHKVMAQQDIVTKDYMAMLQSQNPGVKDNLKKRTDDLSIEGIIADKDKVYLIKQAVYDTQHGSHNDTQSHNDDIVISVFDKNLKNINNIVINREYSYFNWGISGLSYRLMDNKIYLYYNVNSGLRCSVEETVIDLATLKQEKTARLDKPTTGPALYIDPFAVIWFKDGPMLPNFAHGVGTLFQKVAW